MSLTEFAVPTEVAFPGMTVRELFKACVKANVAGLPFRTADGEFVGKASIRYVLREVYIPQAMIEHANLLGDTITGLRLPMVSEPAMLDMSIDDFVLSDAATITPLSPLAKALAVMEKHDTTYAFIIDDERRYHGTLSIVSLARRLLDRDTA